LKKRTKKRGVRKKERIEVETGGLGLSAQNSLEFLKETPKKRKLDPGEIHRGSK